MKRQHYFKVCAFSDKSLTPVYFYFKGNSKSAILNTLNIWFLKEEWLFIVAPYGKSLGLDKIALSTRKEVTEKLNERLLEIDFANTAFDIAQFREAVKC